MDPLHPIVPHHPEPQAVSAAGRVAPTRRDRQGGQGRRDPRGRRDRLPDEDAVQLEIDGLPPVSAEPGRPAPEDAARPRRIDLTA
jgi:hypothetical protein